MLPLLYDLKPGLGAYWMLFWDLVVLQYMKAAPRSSNSNTMRITHTAGLIGRLPAAAAKLALLLPLFEFVFPPVPSGLVVPIPVADGPP